MQSVLDARARRRIRTLAASGLTVRAIAATLVAEGVPATRSAVDRAMRSEESTGGKRPHRRAISSNQRKARAAKVSDSPLNSQENAPSTPEEIAAYLDRRVRGLVAKVEALQAKKATTRTVDGEVKLLRALADMTDRARALRPPPAPAAPDEDRDVVVAQAELVRELRRRVEAAEESKRGARAALRTLAQLAGLGAEAVRLEAVVAAALGAPEGP